RFRETLPDSLLSELDGETPQFVMASDTCFDGRFGVTYLVLLKDKALGLSEHETAVALSLSDIDSVSTDELYGGGRVSAKLKDGSAVSLISYSRNLVPEFAAAARLVDDAAKGKDLIFPELDGSAFSESGVPLPERGARSPLDVARWKILTRMAEFIRPYRTKIFLLMALITISVLAQMAVPLLTKYIFDNILKQGVFADSTTRGEKLNLFVAFMAASFLVVLGTRIYANSIKVWISGRLTADLRSALHRQMQRLSMSYHNRRESGQLIGRVMNDTGELQHFLVDGVPFLFINLLMFIGIGAILLSLHPLLALCVFLPVPLLLGGGTWFWKKLVPLFHKRGNRHSVLHSVLGESIRGVKAVKALGQEERRHSTFTRSNEGLFKVGYKVERTFVQFFEIMTLFMGMGTVAVWYFGGHAILDPDSDFTVGDLIAFIGYMAMFYGPLQWFTAVVNWMTHAFASSERILQVLDQEPEQYDKPDALALTKPEGRIAFEDVRFSYNRGKEIIKGIDFDIEPGQMIGLVGKSGAGKSTIINLVCRFYNVDSGCIRIDGHDIRDIKLEDWRNNIGIVMQDPFLFSGSITENIAYGNPEAEFEDVVRAARAAKAHEFILDKEEGYDTTVGDGGVDLSGGEKQRIAIARAILSNPPVLILDEATRAVDSETEKSIQEAIANLVKGRTTIAIAHRLATLRNADRLFVIEDGQVIESGSHEELLDLEGGHFAKLVRLQNENNRMRSEQSAYSQN
ncbi:MAG: ABC transporter ATP-binding protein, partial [Verrucomicrobiota bacterium]